MAKLNMGVSPTSVILRVKLLNSSVTTGAGLTGLTSASAGLIIGTIKIGEATTTAYTQAGGTIETIAALGTYAAPTATKCRFKEVDATNHPGVYEIQLADARFASTDNLIISIHGASNLAQCDVEVQCTNLASNLIQISGDTAAADNLESTYDGTGYTNDSAPSTQEQVGRLTSGTAAINTVAESFTKSGAEPETNTYTSTFAEDGVFHIVEDAAGATDAYYQFDVGGNGVPVSVTWQGYAQSQGDSYTIWAYNYGTTSYEQIGTISAVNGTTVVENTYALTNAHVGTGANIGKVRLRFLSADGTAFATDRILCSYAIVTKSAGYSDGAIWVNTNASNTNTEDYVDGTSDNPVSTWAAAKILSTSLGIKKFSIVNGSTITLDANSDNFTFVGHEWTLALGNRSISNTYVEDATVSGTCSGTGIHFRDCTINTCLLTQADFVRCKFPGQTVTLLSADVYVMTDCGTGGGVAPPTFDFGAALGNSQIVLSNWSGGAEVANLNAAGSDRVSIIGGGKLTIASTCAGGTIGIHGNVTITDNVIGGFVGTINDDGRYDVYQINKECDTALTDYDGPTNTEMVDAFTEIKGATWAAGTDTLEHIRDKETDIETSIGALNNISVADIIAGIADGPYDLQEMMRVIFSASSLKSNGGGTATLHFRNADDNKNRITATVDVNGNRTAIVLDGT